MPQNSYDEYLKFANILADASGEILRKSFQTPFSVQQKPDQSPVTEIDVKVEARIRELISKQYPGHGIVGEELDNTSSETEYQWVIDPIDGTKSFIAGYPIFTTLIALLYNHKPIVGVIDQPILKQRWAAATGSKTLYNNTQIANSANHKTLKQANIATTSSMYFTTQQAAKFAELSASSGATILGGDGYAYAMITSGKLDIVVDAGMKPYDFCALPPIIEGSGGVITDWEGKPLTIASSGRVIAAANKELHQEALHLLNDI